MNQSSYFFKDKQTSNSLDEQYTINPPNGANTLSQQLLSRHRNCFEIAILMEHFKHIQLHGHLESVPGFRRGCTSFL